MIVVVVMVVVLLGFQFVYISIDDDRWIVNWKKRGWKKDEWKMSESSSSLSSSSSPSSLSSSWKERTSSYQVATMWGDSFFFLARMSIVDGDGDGDWRWLGDEAFSRKWAKANYCRRLLLLLLLRLTATAAAVGHFCLQFLLCFPVVVMFSVPMWCRVLPLAF